MMDVNYEQARQFFLEGVMHYQAARYAQAEQKFAASLALVPGRVSALINLGAARLKLGRAQEALAVLDEALVQEPGSFEALAHRGAALAELGHLTEALEALDQSLAGHPGQGLAWSHRGSVLKDLGRPEEAIESFRQAIAHGADRELNSYYLASLTHEATPAAPPRQYVAALFDGYAHEFEQHLQELHYDAPAVLARHVGASGRRFRHALDLGCGTGLCGRLLKPLCGAIDGIDLSANMLDTAQRTGAYQLLEQADAAEFLGVTERCYDLVVAADVFIYVGALDRVLAGVARVLEPGGLFGFTLERAADGDFALQSSLRYAHSEAYVRRLAAEHGFAVASVEERPIREDQRVPVAGLFVWLAKPLS
jgi:predicted TPR repeat methyltransferase